MLKAEMSKARDTGRYGLRHAQKVWKPNAGSDGRCSPVGAIRKDEDGAVRKLGAGKDYRRAKLSMIRLNARPYTAFISTSRLIRPLFPSIHCHAILPMESNGYFFANIE